MNGGNDEHYEIWHSDLFAPDATIESIRDVVRKQRIGAVLQMAALPQNGGGMARLFHPIDGAMLRILAELTDSGSIKIGCVEFDRPAERKVSR